MSMALQTTYNAFPAIAIAGQLLGADKLAIPMGNADSVSIPFGTPVAFKPSGATDQDAYLPAASTDKIAGIVLHSDAYARVWTDSAGVTHGDLDGTGLVVGCMMNVLRRGIVAVSPVVAVVPGDRLYISYGTTAGSVYGTTAGEIGNVTDTYALNCSSQAQFLTSCAANGYAWLQCDFTAGGTGVA